MRKFEEKLLKGEELSPEEMQDMVVWGNVADKIEHCQKNWQSEMSIVIKVCDRYFKVDYLENARTIDFLDYPYEVYPIKKMVEITEWNEVEK